MIAMDDGQQLLKWLLQYVLEKHYRGNKSQMAVDMNVDRHTLLRAFRSTKDGQEKASLLVAQQLLWCCMQRGYELDRMIRAYWEQKSDDRQTRCRRAYGWMQGIKMEKNRPMLTLDVVTLLERSVSDWQEILGCSCANDLCSCSAPRYCKYEGNCPIVGLVELAMER